MSKMRLLNTKFWSDNYISELDPSEKLLFLYFITNPFTNICGIYEITFRQIALDTGFDKEMIIKILNRFKKDKKLYWFDGWIWIKNFEKHQRLSGSIQEGIKKGKELVPPQIMAKITQLLGIGGGQGEHSPKHEHEHEHELELEDSGEKIAADTFSVKLKNKSLEPMSLQYFVDYCRSSPQKQMLILADWATYVKPDLETSGQWFAFKQRHLRAANALVPFSEEQISWAYSELEKMTYITKPTLETLLKILT